MNSFLVQINSDDSERLNGDFLSHVQFSFKQVFEKDNHIERVLVSVENAQIPCSFFGINETNDNLQYSYGGADYSINVTHGNYSGFSLCKELIRLFTVNSTPFLSAIVNSQTGKLTLTTLSTNFIIRANSNINKVIGIGSSDLPSVTFSVTCPITINLLGITSIRISSTRLLVNGLSSKGLASTSILATVPVDNASASFGLLSYTNMTLFNPILHLTSLSNFDIQLLDQDSNYINFRNIGWSMTLKFDLIHREDKSHETRLIKTIQDLGDIFKSLKERIPQQPETTQEEDVSLRTEGKPVPPGQTQTVEEPTAESNIEEQLPEDMVQEQEEDDLRNDMGDLSLLLDSQKDATIEQQEEDV